MANMTNMARGSTLRPRLITSVADDTMVDNSIVSSSMKERFGRQLNSAKKDYTCLRHASKSEPSLNTSDRQTSYHVTQQRLRKVSFGDKLTLKIIKRIPKIYATDIWYTANDMVEFRTRVLNCNELRLKVKIKSARCQNHMRRVLLEYRINRGHEGKKATTRCVTTRNSLNLSSISIRSSKKPREAAIKNATALEKEIIADQSFFNPTISSACFGPSRRWVFDYYLGSLIDTLCTVI